MVFRPKFALSIGIFAIGTGAVADVALVGRAAERSFAAMPQVTFVDQISGQCGADLRVNSQIAYCTSRNEILMTNSAAKTPEAGYLLAHTFGHAVQVQHGVADIALRTIRDNPTLEADLRGYVARQVDCIAGVIYARSGLPKARLAQWRGDDPFDGPHWGRMPLSNGPRMGIGNQARDKWFQTGQNGQLSACAVGVFGADLLLRADRW